METDRLRYFCTIAEVGSLTKAAEILSVSHSGLSKAMSVLQEELSVQLLRPLGRGLELTEEGKKVYQQSKDLLSRIELLKNPGFASEDRFLRIGMTEVLSLTLTGELTHSFAALLDLSELDSGEIEVKILKGVLDFGLTTVPFPQPELEYLKVKKFSMGIFHHNLDFNNISLEQVPFVIPNSSLENNPLSIKSRDGWPLEVKRSISFKASNLALALEIVKSGAAAIFIPTFLGKRLKLHELEAKGIKASSRDIYLVKKKNIEESKEMKTVTKAVRKLC